MRKYATATGTATQQAVHKSAGCCLSRIGRHGRMLNATVPNGGTFQVVGYMAQEAEPAAAARTASAVP